jgi:lipid A ethanolaminephosphotransferase
MLLKLFRKPVATIGSVINKSKNSFVKDETSEIHPNRLMLLMAIGLASLGNVALWLELYKLPEMNDARAIWFCFAFAILIASVICILLSLLCWRWTLKPVISLFLLTAVFGAYFMLSYGVVIDNTMLVNVLQTDFRESRDLISLKMILVVILFAAFPLIWLWRKPVKKLTAGQQILHNSLLFMMGLILAIIAVFPIYQDFASIMRNNIQLRFLVNPLNSFYALGDVLLARDKKSATMLIPIGLDAKIGPTHYTQPKAPLVILVVGETARSENFGINGYGQNTTPHLKNLQDNRDGTGVLSSFNNVWSCGTSTATSLPCMFSHLGKTDYEKHEGNIENLVDVIQRAGFAVLWLENQSGCKGVCDRIPRVSTGSLTEPVECSSGECFDEIMLNKLSERLMKFSQDRLEKGIVVVMHQMGSHGPAYYKRTPQAFKKFQPECNTSSLQDCSREQVTNAYDNTILYTDYFLSKVIQFLKDTEPHAETAMLYLSDHGESLGENNIYLHGLPYAIAPNVQRHIPWISWLSNDYLNRLKISSECLNQSKSKKMSHDNYFHTVLGLLDIQTSEYKLDLDVYAPCRIK